MTVDPRYHDDDPTPIRDAVVAWVKRHQAACDDQTCQEPENLLAWLAHCAGVRNVEDFKYHFTQYEMHCGDPNCLHLRTDGKRGRNEG